jgi:hypothetical protein
MKKLKQGLIILLLIIIPSIGIAQSEVLKVSISITPSINKSDDVNLLLRIENTGSEELGYKLIETSWALSFLNFYRNEPGDMENNGHLLMTISSAYDGNPGPIGKLKPKEKKLFPYKTKIKYLKSMDLKDVYFEGFGIDFGSSAIIFPTSGTYHLFAEICQLPIDSNLNFSERLKTKIVIRSEVVKFKINLGEVR